MNVSSKIPNVRKSVKYLIDGVAPVLPARHLDMDNHAEEKSTVTRLRPFIVCSICTLSTVRKGKFYVPSGPVLGRTLHANHGPLSRTKLRCGTESDREMVTSFMDHFSFLILKQSIVKIYKFKSGLLYFFLLVNPLCYVTDTSYVSKIEPVWRGGPSIPSFITIHHLLRWTQVKGNETWNL